MASVSGLIAGGDNVRAKIAEAIQVTHGALTTVDEASNALEMATNRSEIVRQIAMAAKERAQEAIAMAAVVFDESGHEAAQDGMAMLKAMIDEIQDANAKLRTFDEKAAESMSEITAVAGHLGAEEGAIGFAMAADEKFSQYTRGL